MAFSALFGPINHIGELYVRALTNAYRQGVRVYDPDYAAQQDPEAYDKIRRDPIVNMAAKKRLHSVAGREWNMVAASESPVDQMAAGVLEQALKEIHRFSAGRLNLAESVFMGQTFAKIEGKRVVRSFGDGKVRRWWVPTLLRDMRKWRFRQRPTAGATDKSTVWQVWNLEREEWLDLSRGDRRQLIVHTYLDTEDTLGYGRGLMEALYHYYWMKTTVMREGLQGIERWSQGWITAGIDGLREGSTDRDNDSHATAWLDMLDKSRARHVAVHDKDDEIKIHETSGTGHEIIMSMVHYLDEAMTRLILAGTLPTGGGSAQHGSFARAETEADSTEGLLQYDRDLLAEDITRDLVALVWKLNRSNLAALGLQAARMPKFIVQHQKKGDPNQAAEVLLKVLQAGIAIRKDEAYTKLEYTPPGPEDEVITLDAEAGLGGRNPVTGQFGKSGGDEKSSGSDNSQLAPAAPTAVG